MNEIFYGEIPVHSNKNGVYALSASCDWVDGSSATCDIQLDASHDALQYMRNFDTERELQVFENGKLAFCGRITSMAEDIEGITTIQAEDALAYLNDSVIRAYANYELENYPILYLHTADGMLRWYLDQHNFVTDKMRNIFIGDCFATGLQVQLSSNEYATTKNEIASKLVEPIGGHLRMRYENGCKYLDWIKNAGTCSQVVQYGSNMLSFSETSDVLDVYTAIVPVGKDGITLDDNDKGIVPSDFGYFHNAVINEELASEFGYIEKYVSYPDITTKWELANAAAKDLRFIQAAETIEVTALDLSLTGEATEQIEYLQIVNVQNKITGCNRSLICTSKHLDVINPANNVFTLGKNEATLSSMVGGA